MLPVLKALFSADLNLPRRGACSVVHLPVKVEVFLAKSLLLVDHSLVMLHLQADLSSAVAHPLEVDCLQALPLVLPRLLLELV